MEHEIPEQHKRPNFHAIDAAIGSTLAALMIVEGASHGWWGARSEKRIDQFLSSGQEIKVFEQDIRFGFDRFYAKCPDGTKIYSADIKTDDGRIVKVREHSYEKK